MINLINLYPLWLRCTFNFLKMYSDQTDDVRGGVPRSGHAVTGVLLHLLILSEVSSAFHECVRCLSDVLLQTRLFCMDKIDR